MKTINIVYELNELKNRLVNDPRMPLTVAQKAEEYIKHTIEKVRANSCPDCPVAEKLDNLVKAIEQGYMIAENCKTPFKVSCIEQEISAEEAEKMVRGTD